MELVNMQMPGTKVDSQETIAAEPSKSSQPSQPEYPYGLQISLDNDGLQKLGIDISTMRVGDGVLIQAKAEVKSVSISENSYNDGKIEQRLELQITDIAINPPTEESFEDTFNQITAKDDAKLYKGINESEVPTRGGFKKGLWEATR